MTHRFIPIGQIVTGVDREWEYPIIWHENQQRSITVSCDPVKGYAEPLRQSMISRMADIKLPAGYTMSWEGEFSDSQESREPLQKIFPICALFMFIILVGLFNSLRKPLMIFLTLPLSIIGIAAGLLLFSSPFGFMSILGFLGLSGMLIKNAIVLIEQVGIQMNAGTPAYQAILDASGIGNHDFGHDSPGKRTHFLCHGRDHHGGIACCNLFNPDPHTCIVQPGVWNNGHGPTGYVILQTDP